jgi:hypothetical protein
MEVLNDILRVELGYCLERGSEAKLVCAVVGTMILEAVVKPYAMNPESIIDCLRNHFNQIIIDIQNSLSISLGSFWEQYHRSFASIP